MPSRCGNFGAAIYAAFAGFGAATIEIERVETENRLVPYGDVARETLRLTLAIRTDGSRAMRWRQTRFHHAVFEREAHSGGMVLDAAQRRIIWLVDGGRTWHSIAPCALPPVHTPEPARCAMDSALPPKALPDRLLLGTPAQAWRWPGGFELWLSPRFRCARVYSENMEYNDWGLPQRHTRERVVSVKWGEPDARLFEVPGAR